MSVGKNELAHRVAKLTSVTRDQAEAVIDCFLQEWQQTLLDGEKVELTHFITSQLVPETRNRSGMLENNNISCRQQTFLRLQVRLADKFKHKLTSVLKRTGRDLYSR